MASGDIRRLMVFMPPGSAKSTYTSKLFPAWFMSQAPGLNIIGASNTAELAANFSREVQGFVRDDAHMLGYGLVRENVELWHTTHHCQYRAVGVGGTITGFRGDLAIIDDPVRSREDADSETIRDKTWNWYQADLVTRMKPGGRIVLIQTRWHEDDLGGRLLATQTGLWDVLCLPATAKENDPLSRAPGELLWADDPNWGYGKDLAEKRAEAERSGAMRDWNALFEQDPRPLDGGIFNTARIKVVDVPPPVRRVVRGWDFAATAQTGTRNPDYTVGVKLGVTEAGEYVILGVFRDRGGPEDVERWLVDHTLADGRGVRVSIPQDPGQAGKMQVQYFTRKLAGYAVTFSPETGEKDTRAMPFASQMNAGNVLMVRAAWNAAYLEELRSFPSGVKDDQIDASSRAFNTLANSMLPARRIPISFMGR